MSSASIVVSSSTSASRVALSAEAPRAKATSGTGSVSRMRRWSVQSPPRTTSVGMPGSGVMLPKEPPPPANSKEVT